MSIQPLSGGSPLPLDDGDIEASQASGAPDEGASAAVVRGSAPVQVGVGPVGLPEQPAMASVLLLAEQDADGRSFSTEQRAAVEAILTPKGGHVTFPPRSASIATAQVPAAELAALQEKLGAMDGITAQRPADLVATAPAADVDLTRAAVGLTAGAFEARLALALGVAERIAAGGADALPEETRSALLAGLWDVGYDVSHAHHALRQQGAGDDAGLAGMREQFGLLLRAIDGLQSEASEAAVLYSLREAEGAAWDAVIDSASAETRFMDSWLGELERRLDDAAGLAGIPRDERPEGVREESVGLRYQHMSGYRPTVRLYQPTEAYGRPELPQDAMALLASDRFGARAEHQEKVVAFALAQEQRVANSAAALTATNLDAVRARAEKQIDESGLPDIDEAMRTRFIEEQVERAAGESRVDGDRSFDELIEGIGRLRYQSIPGVSQEESYAASLDVLEALVDRATTPGLYVLAIDQALEVAATVLATGEPPALVDRATALQARLQGLVSAAEAEAPAGADWNRGAPEALVPPPR